MRFSAYVLLIAVALFQFLLGSCSESETGRIMDHAESLMEEHPDSALNLLIQINCSPINSRKEKARHALLMSMALDKNYIDTTTFDVLQPAIDYYPSHGNPDEKLRTYYYQGRIYQNRGDDSHAMTSFIRASETVKISDTLTLARTHVAMSVLYRDMYVPKEMISHALVAADTYKSIDKRDLRMSCYIQALQGALLTENKLLTDSILNLCENLNSECDESYREDLVGYRLTYSIKYGDKQDIKSNIDMLLDLRNPSGWIIIEIARGFLILGETDKAEEYIYKADSIGSVSDNEKYLIVKSEILEAMGKHGESLDTFKEFYTNDAVKIMSGEAYDLSFVTEEHIKEVNMLRAEEHRNYIIYGISGGFIILLIIFMMLVYRHKLIKAKLKLSKTLQERLETEKKNTELERNNQILISENLNMQIYELHDEIDLLRDVLSRKDSMSKAINNAVKERIEVLNALIASAISSNPKYSKVYDEWKDRIIRDHEVFMNSTRLALKASHPEVIKHLEEHGLNESEINYACLYTLGLNGKEIGKYIHSQRHYHISSDIRKKLGLDINNTNLGNYIRKLMGSRKPEN